MRVHNIAKQCGTLPLIVVTQIITGALGRELPYTPNSNLYSMCPELSTSKLCSHVLTIDGIKYTFIVQIDSALSNEEIEQVTKAIPYSVFKERLIKVFKENEKEIVY